MRRTKICTVLLVLVSVVGLPWGRNLFGFNSPQNQEAAFVQVTSVTVEPTTVHAAGGPNSATVTVQFMFGGNVPDNTTATIELNTYVTHPPGINVNYGPAQSVVLKKSPGAARFEVKADAHTLPGRVVVAASIVGVTNNLKVKPPEQPQDWRAEFQVANP